MRIPTTIRSLFTFYKSFFVPGFVVTLICCFLFIEYGTPILLVLLWVKLSTTAIIFFYVRTYKAKEFYYYRNLGLPPAFLWFSTLTFDLILYLRVCTGTITGLLGRNGAGKSCLLQIIYGTLPATAHSINFDDRHVSRPYLDPHLIRFLPQFTAPEKLVPIPPLQTTHFRYFPNTNA